MINFMSIKNKFNLFKVPTDFGEYKAHVDKKTVVLATSKLLVLRAFSSIQ